MNILEAALTAALTVEQRKAGFTLAEEDDHFLLVKKDGKVIAVMNASTATIEEIRKIAKV